MQTLPPAVASHLAARKGLLVHVLLWISARDRSTQAVETVGLWTGADHQTITVGGVARTYYGVGAMLAVDGMVAAADMKEGDWSFQVSPLHGQVVEVLRTYEARLAPVECHLWYCNPLTGLPLADPIREFRGTIMEVDLPTPEEGGTAAATIRCVSDSWRLSRALTLKRSQAALESRTPGDMFRQYNTISGSVPVYWGEKRVDPTPAGPPPPRGPFGPEIRRA